MFLHAKLLEDFFRKTIEDILWMGFSLTWFCCPLGAEFDQAVPRHGDGPIASRHDALELAR
jgi:hypothetical protein